MMPPIPPLPTGAALAGATLVALATVVGLLLARWSARAPVASSTAVAVLLVAIVGGDLVPDVWHDLGETGTPWWAAALAAAAGFVGAGTLVRRGCLCVPSPDDPPRVGTAEVAGGTATAAAIGVHRAVEGAVLGLTSSVALVATLVVHAGGEGFALGTLLSRASRGRTVLLVAVACLSPLVGATATAAVRLPVSLTPLLTAAVAGALLRSALLALRLAGTRLRAARAAVASRPAVSQPA